ncbi:hypothetical protein PQ469_03525 [Mucilaginibacter sp. KACC 22773]|uniref:hypothetical protein n=1 Tax=Mucilaginibacter sp. KACC 22773 TaxID=3025671 RepID=UPI0023664464|nr:hypothetical protein [Mucilaginibacter sp. KACC 22773]WDF79076.1 hypothetical protein PQ469_03525 [Mucilaginibacter sp. KACC 22773]
MDKRIYHTAIPGIRTALFIIVGCQWFMAHAQTLKTGSLKYLMASNGFNGCIALGKAIGTLPYGKLTYLDGDSRIDADSCIKYAYNEPYAFTLGDSIDLDMVAVRAYKDSIVNIYLFFKLSDAYKVLKKFISLYGQFTEKPDNYSDIYNWNSSQVSLSLRYQCKADLGVAIFTCKKLETEIEADKQRAIRRYYKQALSLNY